MGNILKINPVILGFAVLVICICFYFILFPIITTHLSGQKEPVTVFATYNAPFGKLNIATNLSDRSQNMTLYRVTSQNYDMVDYWNGDPVNMGNVTSEVEAPQVAQKILERYGGLPKGAGPLEAETEYIEEINGVTGQVVDRTPYTTVVNCQRSLDGMPVIGGYIRMELGYKGELRNLKKVWRTVTSAGTTQVIPATEALKKILRGDILNEGHPRCTCDLTVNKVQLAYLENDYNESQEYLTPIWVFSGTLSSGGGFSYRVSALDSLDNSLDSPDLSRLITEIYALPPTTDVGLNIPPITIEKGNNSY